MTLPRLTTNARSWLATWKDSGGRRRFKILGKRSEIGPREAQKRLDAFATLHAKNPAMKDIGKAPSISEYLAHYFLQRNDLDEATLALHRTTGDRLLECFAPTLRLSDITRKHAGVFRTWLTEWTYTRAKGKDAKKYTLSPASIRRHVATAKQLFQWASDKDMIPFNPFDREKLGSAPAQEDWHYVDEAAMAKVFEACPSLAWRTTFALARRAGLRLNEIQRAEWGWIDWQDRTIGIRRKHDDRDTTKSYARTVPISPELHAALREAYEAAGDGATFICPALGESPSHKAAAILTAAGLAWKKPLHSLRKSLETDWLAVHPLPDVVKWLGHDPSIALKHYHRTKPETVGRVTGTSTPTPAEVR